MASYSDVSSLRTTSIFSDVTLATPPLATDHSLIQATVHSVEYITPTLVRIVLEAPEFSQHELTGPDEFFGLLMPQPQQPFASPEDFAGGKIEGLNIRAAVAAMPPEVRPGLRWYTIRRIDPERGLLIFDVATHGVTEETLTQETGPGLTWCLGAKPGDPAGVWTCQGLWHRQVQSQLLVADPSSLPSVRAILEFTATHAPEQLSQIHVVAVTDSAQDSEPELHEQWIKRLASVTVLEAGNVNAATETVIAELTSRGELGEVDYVWVAGEGDLCKAVRSHAIKQWKINKDNILWCPYWFIGKARP